LEDPRIEIAEAAARWNTDWQRWVYEGTTQPGITSWDQVVALAGQGPPVLVLVDEAQLAYRYTSDFPFWRAVKDALGNGASSRLSFILLATSNISQEPGMSTPFQFPVENTLGFEDLRLNADERKFIFDGASKSFGHPLGSVMADEGAPHFSF
jgi:hypothetical protein